MLRGHCGPYKTLGEYVAAQLAEESNVLCETFDNMASDELSDLALDSFVGVECVILMSHAQRFIAMLDEPDQLEVAQATIRTMIVWLHG